MKDFEIHSEAKGVKNDHHACLQLFSESHSNVQTSVFPWAKAGKEKNVGIFMELSDMVYGKMMFLENAMIWISLEIYLCDHHVHSNTCEINWNKININFV